MEVLQALVATRQFWHSASRLESPSGPLLGRAWYFRVYVSCWLLVKKVFSKKSAMLVVASYMSHRVLVQPSLDALYRGATEDFCSVRVCVSKSSVLLNAFFACFFWMPCTGDLVYIFCRVFSDLPWSDSGKIVVWPPCFFAGCWWKSRSLKNIARCGHMCQSKLGLLCSFKTAWSCGLWSAKAGRLELS